MKKKSEGKMKKKSVGKWVVAVVLLMYAISLLLPLGWALNSSLKGQIEYSTYNVNGLPREWLFSNYKQAFTILRVGNQSFFSMIFNSLWYAVGGAVLGILVSAMTAYVVSRYRFPGRNFFYFLAIFSMMIPIVGSAASQYRVYTALHIVNSPLFLVTALGGFGFNFLVLYAYFRNLPWSCAESAFIDGAGHVRVFFEIMLPQAMPAAMALTVVAVIGRWNDYSTPLLFLKDFPTLASGLYMFQMVTTREMNMPVLFAGLIICALPILLLYVVFSDKIIDISYGGALKG